MTNCKCCGKCCKCSRLVKDVNVNILGREYVIDINKIMSELNCFYYFYIGDGTGYYRYPDGVSATQTPITRYSYRDFSITVDFRQDSEDISEFEMVCPNVDVEFSWNPDPDDPTVFGSNMHASISGYATHKIVQEDKKLVLSWPDSRLVAAGMNLILKYKDLTVNALGFSVNGIFSGMKNAIDQLAQTYPELSGATVTFGGNPLDPLEEDQNILEAKGNAKFVTPGGLSWRIENGYFRNYVPPEVITIPPYSGGPSSKYKLCHYAGAQDLSITGASQTIITGMLVCIYFEPIFDIQIFTSYYQNKKLYEANYSCAPTTCVVRGYRCINSRPGI